MQNGFLLLSNLKKNSLLCLIILTLACTNENHFKPIPVEYPITQKSDHVDSYWGEEIADPYRWLEDDYAENTKEWVIAQNKVTFDYLNKIPFREAIRISLCFTGHGMKEMKKSFWIPISCLKMAALPCPVLPSRKMEACLPMLFLLQDRTGGISMSWTPKARPY